MKKIFLINIICYLSLSIASNCSNGPRYSDYAADINQMIIARQAQELHLVNLYPFRSETISKLFDQASDKSRDFDQEGLDSILFTAAFHNKSEVFKLALRCGANKRSTHPFIANPPKTVLYVATFFKHQEIINILS